MGMRNPLGMVRLALLALMVSGASVASAQDSVHSCQGVGGGGAPEAKAKTTQTYASNCMTPKQKAKFRAHMQTLSKPYQFREKATEAIAVVTPDSAAIAKDAPMAGEILTDSTSQEMASYVTYTVTDTLAANCPEKKPATHTQAKPKAGGGTHKAGTAKTQPAGSTTAQAQPRKAGPPTRKVEHDAAVTSSTETAMGQYVASTTDITWKDPSCGCDRVVRTVTYTVPAGSQLATNTLR